MRWGQVQSPGIESVAVKGTKTPEIKCRRGGNTSGTAVDSAAGLLVNRVRLYLLSARCRRFSGGCCQNGMPKTGLFYRCGVDAAAKYRGHPAPASGLV